MTTTINASTSSGLLVTPDNSGNVLLQYNGVAAPAFAVYPSASTTIAGTATKIAFDTKEFDTASCYNTTTYRFTPTVAGYYQINGQVMFNNTTSWCTVYIYKNGSTYRQGNEITTGTGNYFSVSVSSLVYLNGSTDYVELWGNGGTTYTTPNTGNSTYNFFNGCLLRGA